MYSVQAMAAAEETQTPCIRHSTALPHPLHHQVLQWSTASSNHRALTGLSNRKQEETVLVIYVQIHKYIFSFSEC